MLPHQFPFRFVDRALGSGRAELGVTANAAWLRGAKAVPLSLVVEIVAQAAAHLFANNLPGEELRLAAIESAKLDGAIEVGDRLSVEIEIERSYGRLIRIQGRLEVENRVVAHATVVLAGAEAG